MKGVRFNSIHDLPPYLQEQAREQLGQKAKGKRKPRGTGRISQTWKPVGKSEVRDDGSILLVIPLPPRSCSPNASVSWPTVYKAKKRLAQWTLAAIMEACGSDCRRMWKRASVQYSFFCRKGKLIDVDNATASMKAFLDQLQKSGIVENDRGVEMLPVFREECPSNPRVEIVVSAL